MKKFLTLLCVIVLIFTLGACSKKGDNLSNSDITSSSNEATVFVAPDNYLAVLTLKINPEFDLYLDNTYNVIAVNPLNDDAKTFADEIATATDKTLGSIIEKIIAGANTNGYIKGDSPSITISVTSLDNREIDKQGLLSDAKTAAQAAIAKLKLTVTVNTSDNTQITSSKPSDTSSKQVNSHKHTYSQATCTEAAKCSCGATSGKAAGHKWQAATCKAPKTCSVCKATEGSKGAHSYKDGKCTVCGAKNSVSPKTDLKYDVEISGNFRLADNELAASGISFHNNSADGLHCVLLSHYLTTDLSQFEDTDPAELRKVTYNGTTYYHYGAGQSPHHIELTDSEIIVKNVFWNEDTSIVTLKLVMIDANNLKVTYSTDSEYPVGTVLSTNWQSTIK